MVCKAQNVDEMERFCTRCKSYNTNTVIMIIFSARVHRDCHLRALSKSVTQFRLELMMRNESS